MRKISDNEGKIIHIKASIHFGPTTKSPVSRHRSASKVVPVTRFFCSSFFVGIMFLFANGEIRDHDYTKYGG